MERLLEILIVLAVQEPDSGVLLYALGFLEFLATVRRFFPPPLCTERMQPLN